MDIVTFVLIALPILIGAWALIYQPFRRKGWPASADMTVAIVMACILLIIAGTKVVTTSQEQEKAAELCGPATLEGQCYRLPELVCQNMWKKYQSECQKEIKQDLEGRVTALIGPATKKCTQKKFDKSLYYTRRNTDEAPCQEYFKSLSK